MSFDFEHAVQAPFRMQPGLRRIAPGARQLTPNQRDSKHLRAKLDVLSVRASSALLIRPGFDAGPALAQLSMQAALEHPQAWRINEDDSVSAPWLGWSEHQGELQADTGASVEAGACLRAIEPSWRRAALMALAFAEDFAVADASDASIPWLAVALPSRWVPAQKIGRSFTEVHHPVADNRLIVSAADHLLRLVTGDERWERYVWTIARSASLDAHPEFVQMPEWQPDADAVQIAAAAWLRTEYQTFIPIPDVKQAVFTIHIETQPLQDAIDSSARAEAMHDALATMSAAILDYRGLTVVRDRLLEWLCARAKQLAPAPPANGATSAIPASE